jgi:hypothetical protein
MAAVERPLRRRALREGVQGARKNWPFTIALVVLSLVLGGALGGLVEEIDMDLWPGDDDEDEEGGGGASNDIPYEPVIVPSDFVAGVDNTLFPLHPGTRWVYETVTEGGTERTVIEVTNGTKLVMGVTCVVVRDTVSLDGTVIEDTLDWYAQDVRGNVWYLGEDSKEYEGGEVVGTAGSWEAGVGGARPGIIMLAHPEVGLSYHQEYLKGEAEDLAQVLSLTATATVPTGSYSSMLQTREWTPLEPDVAEDKYYAAGIGCVLEVGVRGGTDRTELVEHVAGP